MMHNHLNVQIKRDYLFLSHFFPLSLSLSWRKFQRSFYQSVNVAKMQAQSLTNETKRMMKIRINFDLNAIDHRQFGNLLKSSSTVKSKNQKKKFTGILLNLFFSVDIVDPNVLKDIPMKQELMIHNLIRFDATTRYR